MGCLLDLKVFVTIFVIVIAVLSVVFVYKFNNKASVARQELNQERYSRMIAEENIEKNKAALQSLRAELARAKAKVKMTKGVLKQSVTVNKGLKERLETADLVRETLEQKIIELEEIATEDDMAEAVVDEVY